MLLDRIRAEMAILSRVEQKIAEVLVENPEAFIRYSTTELAEKADVSQGSINNFARKFVEGGFSALKLHLALEMNNCTPSPQDFPAPMDGISDILRSSMDAVLEAFRQTQALNSEAMLVAVAQMILQARKIEVYGIFTSSILAMDCYYQLLQLGFPTHYVTDVLLCPVSAAMLHEQDLVIAISSSGKTKDVYDALKIARSRGAKCICITRNKNGPIASLCDVTLQVPSGANPVNERTAIVRHCVQYLLDAICTYIRFHTEANGAVRYEELTRIISSHSMEE